MRFDNDLVPFNEGSCMIIFPDVLHHFHSDDKRGVTLVQLEFLISNLDGFFESVDPEHSLSFFINLKTHSKKFMKFQFISSLRDCLERIIHEECSREENFELLREVYYRELIILLSRHINKNLNLESLSGNPYVIKALDIIHQRFCNAGLKSESIAAECAITPRYLRMLFKQYLHMSPMEYINHLKINEAKNMLISDCDRSIKEIAYVIGYNSPQYFSDIFKKDTGFTPLAFKKRYFRKIE